MNRMSALIVNCFGGPGTGKSTVAAHVFAELKWLGINCELATEYAKEKVWEGSFNVLNNQRLVYGKQYHMVWRPSQQVEVVLTDSPLLLSAIYSKPEDSLFRALVIEDFKKFNNVNIFLVRKKAYVQAGRLQDEEQAIEKDNEIKEMLVDNGIEFITVTAVRENVMLIVQHILEQLAKSKAIL